MLSHADALSIMPPFPENISLDPTLNSPWENIYYLLGWHSRAIWVSDRTCSLIGM